MFVISENALLSVDQVADYLNISTKTVRRLIADEKIKASKVGRSWRIKKDDLNDYLVETLNCNRVEGIL